MLDLNKCFGVFQVSISNLSSDVTRTPTFELGFKLYPKKKKRLFCFEPGSN